MQNKYASLLVLILLIALSFCAALIGAQFTPGQWYVELIKPAWTPPNWLFGPVWTVLYILIAVAAWLVWRSLALAKAKIPLALWLLQLSLNAAWSWLCFGLQRLDLALIDIVLLLGLSAAITLLFYRIRALAGLLFVPYLLWVGFASYLNYELWRLNS